MIQKVAIILGTRPEIIKMCPVILRLKELKELKELEESKDSKDSKESKESKDSKYINYFILHTGQHYSYNMDKIFFEQLGLQTPKYNIDVKSGAHGEQTGKMLINIEKILMSEKPDIILVEGDTNSVLAGALAASKLGIKIGHIEAGLRSYDRTMPEEINRVLTDHCSDYLFAPTEVSKQILLKEGIEEEKIFVTGNTIVDSIYHNLKNINLKNINLKNINLGNINLENINGQNSGQIKVDDGYFLATIHRQENVDNIAKFKNILIGLKKVRDYFQVPIIYPIHPRSKEILKTIDINLDWIQIIDPVDYLGFLYLESKARLILTDSGGVQEESCILGVPCVTLRENTERPETLTVGSNILSGVDPCRIFECAHIMIRKKHNWANPFGDGNSGKRIVDILTNI